MKPEFICVGAQKAGTTTLYRLLKENPEICFSDINKEVPFFTERDLIVDGWDQYTDRFFSDCRNGRMGLISPQYMYSDEIAFSIYRMFPETKIITLLRNPIERAISHYNMNVSRGLETRTFSKVIKEELKPRKIQISRNIVPQRFELHKEVNCYFTWGEYGRILKSYFKVFPRDKVLVLFSEDLKRCPKNVIDRVSNFLDIEPYYPEYINEKFHVTATSEYDRIFNILEHKLNYIKRVRLIPESFRQIYRDYKQGLRKPPNKITIEKEDLKRMQIFFVSDLVILKNELKIANIPWESKLKSEDSV